MSFRVLGWLKAFSGLSGGLGFAVFGLGLLGFNVLLHFHEEAATKLRSPTAIKLDSVCWEVLGFSVLLQFRGEAVVDPGGAVMKLRSPATRSKIIKKQNFRSMFF